MSEAVCYFMGWICVSAIADSRLDTYTDAGSLCHSVALWQQELQTMGTKLADVVHRSRGKTVCANTALVRF